MIIDNYKPLRNPVFYRRNQFNQGYCGKKRDSGLPFAQELQQRKPSRQL
jgi:hypothetical protein